MSTVTLWLLIVISAPGINGNRTPHVLERFATIADCEHVLKNIPGTYFEARCVQAKVIR